MNQLLMAAARGARIESEYHNWSNGGTDWRNLDMPNTVCARIHPDDEHLRFGPVSGSLREFAKEGVWLATLSGLMAEIAFRYECEYPFVLECEWKDACTFALILSEALADKGL